VVVPVRRVGAVVSPQMGTWVSTALPEASRSRMEVTVEQRHRAAGRARMRTVDLVGVVPVPIATVMAAAAADILAVAVVRGMAVLPAMAAAAAPSTAVPIRAMQRASIRAGAR